MMKMLCVLIQWEGITVCVNLATQGMAHFVKLFVKTVVKMEVLVSLQACVCVLKVLLALDVKQTLTNARMALLSVTAALIASTCLDGTTASAGTATTTTGCFHQMESHVKTLMNVRLGGTAVPVTLFASIWMADMTAGVLMEKTVLGTVSMKAK